MVLGHFCKVLLFHYNIISGLENKINFRFSGFGLKPADWRALYAFFLQVGRLWLWFKRPV